MKCFNCGKGTGTYLCPDCRTEGILGKIFEQIRFYKPETCENPHLEEYVAALTGDRAERNCIPNILALFPVEVTEYYQCLYYWIHGIDEFEAAAESYLSRHAWIEEKSQMLISYLLKKYIRNDFIKPYQWRNWIARNGDPACKYIAR